MCPANDLTLQVNKVLELTRFNPADGLELNERAFPDVSNPGLTKENHVKTKNRLWFKLMRSHYLMSKRLQDVLRLVITFTR
jgi:hypothetical protein